MVEKIRTFILKHADLSYAFLVFAFFLIISSLSPINGDDWGNHIIGMRGLRGWIGQAIGMYFDWEGRFAGRLFINALTFNKCLWNILNALATSSLYFLIIKLVKPKQITLTSIILILGILLIGNDMFTQIYLWIAGNITYFVPLVLILIYLYMIDYYLKNKKLFKWYIYVVWFILNLMIPMFVEHMGVIMIIINLSLLIYLSLKQRNFNKLFLYSLLVSFISFLSMVLSPGTAARVAFEASSFNNASLFEKIMINLPNFIQYTITKNNFLLIIFPVSFIYLGFGKTNNRYLRFLISLVNIIPLMVIALNVVNSPWFNENTFISIVRKVNFLYEMNFVTISYWLIYLISFFILLLLHFKDRQAVIFYFLLGMLANGVMLLSPIWGSRTSLFTVYMLIITNLFVISEINFKNMRPIIVFGKLSIIVIMSIYIILYYNVYLQNNKRESDIDHQLKANINIIEIEKIPDYALWGINPEGNYHLKTFKDYYDIPQEKEISLIPIKYKYFIFYK